MPGVHGFHQALTPAEVRAEFVDQRRGGWQFGKAGSIEAGHHHRNRLQRGGEFSASRLWQERLGRISEEQDDRTSRGGQRGESAGMSEGERVHRGAHKNGVLAGEFLREIGDRRGRADLLAGVERLHCFSKSSAVRTTSPGVTAFMQR